MAWQFSRGEYYNIKEPMLGAVFFRGWTAFSEQDFC